MYKKTLLIFTILLGFALPIDIVRAQGIQQVNTTSSLYNLPIAPITSNRKNPSESCPVETQPIYSALGDTCASGFDDFLTNPIGKHYWVEDPAITAQGKADERARQFLYWVVNTGTVNEQEVPILGTIWRISSSIALFGVVLIASIFGIGYIISRRTNYNLNIQVWPTLIKLGAMLLYIVSSAAIVFVLIQLSDILMKFFIDNLGGNQLFNIYFSGNPAHQNLIGQTEANYKDFVGCRDLNIRVQEGIDTEVFLLKMTNVSYYVMGVMLLLRKILLWFLLFVSPFLALLMPFVLIRNTGWIWIGVFFQWLFYGPLLALFLGGMAKIWSTGIPFKFDFSRVNKVDIGYVYPTGINIVYGGPAQRLARSIGAVNNGNYIDTFVEYIITLIMLWAVTFFPWWLLRIFRDYCCDGIYAMKNILLAMYDQLRGGPPHGPTPGKGPTPPTLKIDTNTPVRADIKISLGTLQEIKNTLSKDISKNLNIEAKHITDIARMETNKTTHQQVNQNIAYLSNPAQAKNPAQKQQFMNIRSELFNRSIKNDTVARTILASTSTSVAEKARISSQLIRSNPQLASIEQISMNNTHRTKQQVASMTNNYVTTVNNNSTVVKNIANSTKTSESNVKSILDSYSKHTNQPVTTIVSTVAREVNISENTVRSVLSHGGAVGVQARILAEMGTEQKINPEQTNKILNAIHNIYNISEAKNTFSTAKQVNKKSLTEMINGFSSTPFPITTKTVENVFRSILNTSNSIISIANITNLDQSVVKHTLQTFVDNSSLSPTEIINTINSKTNVASNQVSNIFNGVSKTLSADEKSIASISSQTNIDHGTVRSILSNTASVIHEHSQNQPQSTTSTSKQSSEIKEPVVRIISYQAGVTEKQSKKFIQKLLRSITTNETVMKSIETSTNLQSQQISNVINTYIDNIDQPVEKLIQKINESSGVSRDQVQSLLKNIAETIISSKAIVAQVAKDQGMDELDVAKNIQDQMTIASEPEKHIEQSINIPQSISIEDYEEVKEMWKKQYEEGEVPVSDTIKTRKEWIEQEIVFITNTLNKILSSDEKLRQEGLDDLGYLLPVFLINNLTGEELMIYLKAKLEAAKFVLEILNREDKIKQEFLQKQEEDTQVYVDVERKTEDDNTHHLDVDENTASTPLSIEDRTKITEERLNQSSDANTDSSPDLNAIKEKLKEKAVN